MIKQQKKLFFEMFFGKILLFDLLNFNTFKTVFKYLKIKDFLAE